MSQTDDLKAFFRTKIPTTPAPGDKVTPIEVRDCLDEVADAFAELPDNPGTGGGAAIKEVRFAVGTAEDSDIPALKTYSNGVTALQDDSLKGWKVTNVRNGSVELNPTTSGYEWDTVSGTLYLASPASNGNIFIVAYKSASSSGGSGIPDGGTTGQVLAKASNADGDVEWIDQTPGGNIPVPTPLTGNAWDLGTDGTDKTLTLTADKTITVTSLPGQEGYLSVLGTGFTLTVAGEQVTLSPSGKTIVTVKDFGNAFYVFSSGGATLSTPAPPTNGVVNDTTNEFDFTKSADEPDNSGYEFQLNSGSITTVTAKPIPVGNIAVPIGGLKVRVKGNSTRNPSAWLTNATAFTVASGGPSDVTFTGLTGISNGGGGAWPRSGTGINLTDQNAVDASEAIASGVDFRYSAEYINELSACFIGMHTSNVQSAAKDTSGSGLWTIYVGSYMGTLFVGGLGVSETTPVASGFTPGAGKRWGVQRISGVFSLVYSSDNGANWTIATTPSFTNPSGNLYRQGAISLSTTGQRIYNPKFELL